LETSSKCDRKEKRGFEGRKKGVVCGAVLGGTNEGNCRKRNKPGPPPNPHKGKGGGGGGSPQKEPRRRRLYRGFEKNAFLLQGKEKRGRNELKRSSAAGGLSYFRNLGVERCAGDYLKKKKKRRRLKRVSPDHSGKKKNRDHQPGRNRQKTALPFVETKGGD